MPHFSATRVMNHSTAAESVWAPASSCNSTWMVTSERPFASNSERRPSIPSGADAVEVSSPCAGFLNFDSMRRTTGTMPALSPMAGSKNSPLLASASASCALA